MGVRNGNNVVLDHKLLYVETSGLRNSSGGPSSAQWSTTTLGATHRHFVHFLFRLLVNMSNLRLIALSSTEP